MTFPFSLSPVTKKRLIADSAEGHVFLFPQPMSDAPNAAAPAVTVDPALAKALKVKHSTVTRNLKDLQYAQAEVSKENERLIKFQAEDPDKVNQQKKVIAEAEMMIPHAISRIRKSADELEAFLRENGDQFGDEEALKEPNATLAAARKVLGVDDD
jgi:tubulin-specific chaperone A